MRPHFVFWNIVLWPIMSIIKSFSTSKKCWQKWKKSFTDVARISVEDIYVKSLITNIRIYTLGYYFGFMFETALTYYNIYRLYFNMLLELTFHSTCSEPRSLVSVLTARWNNEILVAITGIGGYFKTKLLKMCTLDWSKI